MDIKEEIDKDNLPRHIAVIMDGNGRWAKKKGATRIFGHKSAVKSVMETVEGAAELAPDPRDPPARRPTRLLRNLGRRVGALPHHREGAQGTRVRPHGGAAARAGR